MCSVICFCISLRFSWACYSSSAQGSNADLSEFLEHFEITIVFFHKVVCMGLMKHLIIFLIVSEVFGCVSASDSVFLPSFEETSKWKNATVVNRPKKVESILHRRPSH